MHPVVVAGDSYNPFNHGFKAEYCPFRFRGHYYDTDTGLYYIDKKYYDSTNSLFVTPCNFRGLWYNIGEVFGGVSRYALPGGSADFLGIYAPGPLATLELTPTASSSKKISWWEKIFGWLKLPNWAKILIGAVTYAAAFALTFFSGGSCAALFIGMISNVAFGGLLQGTISAIKGNGFAEGAETGMVDSFMIGGIFAFVGSAISFAKNLSLIRSKGVTIGKGMNRVKAYAAQHELTTYSPMKGYTKIQGSGSSKWRLALADDLSLAHNKAWIKRVMRLKKPIYDIGLGLSKEAGLWYSMELVQVKFYPFHFIV